MDLDAHIDDLLSTLASLGGEGKVRTRFAPSPTGFMHVGNVRTALFAWLYARHTNGTFILRIEDTDKKREVEGSIGHIMQSLKWLGIEWDESIDVGGPYEPYIQSDRLGTYKKYAEQLLQAGFAYPDPYTELDVQGFREAAEKEKRPFLYRDHRPTTLQEWNGISPLRFKVPEIKRYTWHDAVLGELSAGEEALDDFILLKSDGYPTYNFAHVVDDIEMKITHVLRAQEFIPSIPKYLSLYEALDQKPPVFGIMPPILGESGTKKLSKRDGAKDILDYRAEGYLPEAMLNFLALLGWHPQGDEEVLTRDDLIREFSLERVQKGGARFDEQKLLHLNQQHMRRLSPEAYLSNLGVDSVDSEILLRALPLLYERARTFGEAREMLTGELACLFAAPVLDRSSLIAKAPKEDGEQSTKAHLEAFMGLIVGLHEDSSAESIKEALMPYADAIPKDHGGRGSALWPLRYALSGAERSPDPFTLIHVLGREESAARVGKAIELISA